MKVEADGFCTAMVEWPKGETERFCFIMENVDLGMKMYFFVTHENVVEIIGSLVEMIGYDA